MVGRTVSHDKILEKSRPELHSRRGSSVFRFAKDENARSDISDRHAFLAPGGTGLGEVRPREAGTRLLPNSTNSELK